MNRKKLFIIAGAVVGVLILAAIIIPLVTPNAQQQTITSNYISGITIAESANADKKPLGVTSSFAVDAPQIAAIVTYANLPANTPVTYEWYSVDADQVIDTDTRTTTTVFSGNSVAVLENTTSGWSRGKYEFRVVLSDKPVARQTYYIKSANEITLDKAASLITNIDLVTAVDVRGAAVGDPQTTFNDTDASIHAVVSYDGADAGTEFEGRWLYVPDGRTIDNYRATLSASGSLTFSIDLDKDAWLPAGKWAKGDYRLDLYINGDLVRGVKFSVK